MKYEIYELYPSARHAYIAIGLAVKTGRPHNELDKLCLPLTNYALSLPADRDGIVEGPILPIVFSKNKYLIGVPCPRAGRAITGTRLPTIRRGTWLYPRPNVQLGTGEPNVAHLHFHFGGQGSKANKNFAIDIIPCILGQNLYQSEPQVWNH